MPSFLHQRSINQSLITKNLIFALLVLVFGTTMVFAVALMLSIKADVAQMAASNILASGKLAEFQADAEAELFRFQSEGELGGRDKTYTARALGRVYRTGKHFQRVLLVNRNVDIIYAYPPEESGSNLSEQEELAAAKAIETGQTQRIVSTINGNEVLLSVIVPPGKIANQQEAVLIGRISVSELVKLINDTGDKKFDSAILDSDNNVLIKVGDEEPITPLPQGAVDNGLRFLIPDGLGGNAILHQSANQSLNFLYVGPQTPQGWNLAMVMPFKIVFSQAAFWGLTFAVMVFALGLVFTSHINRYGRGLSGSISKLARESRSIASGGILTNRIYTNRQDEIGELTFAFTDMQQSLKGRLDELSLLLDVSQDISSSINIRQSMPIILQGALRGTGASGAKVLIINPAGKALIPFVEGPAGSDLAVFDHPLMVSLREKKELALETLQEIFEHTEVYQGSNPPIKALFALPLQSNKYFQGIFVLGYRQAREFTLSERRLLRTLAGQAAVLVENAYLYANAEGGRRRLAAVLASTSEAVIVTDQADRIFVVNQAMETAFQLSAPQVRGRALEDVLESERLVRALKKARIGKLNFEIEGKDGRSYFVNVSSIINQAGFVIGRVGILTDVTRYKEIDRLKSEFVSNVSHDLRTPLTVMNGYIAALLMTDDLTDEQKMFINKISHSVEHMTGMVETLLDLNRIEAGVDLYFEKVDIMALFHEIVDEQWYLAREAGIVLRIRNNRNLPLVTADKSLLNQAIANLLSNAYKYASNSGEVVLTVERDGNEIVISVTDHGPGIAYQDQLRIFEKFYRAKRSDTGDIKGTGLGLGLVKSIAEKHGGNAWVQSELGQGSTFFISIPINRSENLNPST